MKRNEVEKIVEEINSYLKRELWMGFEITQYTNYKLLITGSIDIQSTNSDIEIEFEGVYYALVLFNWETDTSVLTMALALDYETEEIYSKYKMETVTYVFKFYPEDYSGNVECYVCAKNISYTISQK